MWTAYTDRDGYGTLRNTTTRSHSQQAHVIAYELFVGPVNGLFVCHTCDIPGCVNPDHLFLGTHTDNMRDCKRKGRTASGDKNGSRTKPERVARGSRHGLAKLNERTVRRMRILSQRYGFSSYELGRYFGVSQVAAHCVVRRTTWEHVM